MRAAEADEVIARFGGGTVYLPEDGVYGVEVPHANRRIIARYAPDHPFSPPWVYIDPPPSNSHYYVHGGEAHARLCWCRPDQWDPTYHLIVAVGSAITFLNEEVL